MVKWRFSIRSPNTHIDPVCNMKVYEKNAQQTAEHNGKVYYFCSLHCKKQFEEDPQKYIQD